MGRKKLSIDYLKVEALAAIHCTYGEIAQVLGVSVRTLTRNKKFLTVYKKAEAEGARSLKRAMWDKALGREGIPARDKSGNILVDDKGKIQWLVTPLSPDSVSQIWLSKNVLGYSDKSSVTTEETKRVIVTQRVIAVPTEGTTHSNDLSQTEKYTPDKAHSN